ncbi:hypothetical protein ZIOFF_038214 [Zingiber officinale]|uniref:Purple acid phosphatase n=1 Tax=Zingiber officinale TaxID=94328 RepID=A0A8J5GCL6_ZINOF|nr:hypothetical protein ZIOFF_038214 [Zingiber officinale]
MHRPAGAFPCLRLLVVLTLGSVNFCDGGITSSFSRKLQKSVDMPLDSDVFRVPSGHNAPQQVTFCNAVFLTSFGLNLMKVHITLGNHDGSSMIISWVTQDEPGSSKVLYGTDKDHLHKSAQGKHTRYKFYNYTSGYIHHCTIHHLQHDTKYYYAIGIGHTVRTFWFTTPPKVGPDVPYIFGLIGKFIYMPWLYAILQVLYTFLFFAFHCHGSKLVDSQHILSGDLRQTYDSNITLSHYEANRKAQAVLYVGDLSYADHYPNHDNVRWDTWGRFVERSTAYQPWIWTAGNHELDFAPEIGEAKPFKPFTHRYHVPYISSGSTAPFWYSLKLGSAHIIVLASYSAYGKYTPQYSWLEAELPKVNRTETPWLIVLVHSPWYNSYNYHFMEGESMRVMFEQWFVQYKVDVVFSGHVHAYERSVVNGKCEPVVDGSAPVYVTIGDGGNIEGPANNMTEPQPSYSAFREASFGHAVFEIKNRTHAYYAWHRNQDGNEVVADSFWFYNRSWNSADI